MLARPSPRRLLLPIPQLSFPVETGRRAKQGVVFRRVPCAQREIDPTVLEKSHTLLDKHGPLNLRPAEREAPAQTAVFKNDAMTGYVGLVGTWSGVRP